MRKSKIRIIISFIMSAFIVLSMITGMTADVAFGSQNIAKTGTNKVSSAT